MTNLPTNLPELREGLSIAELTAAIRETNVRKGFRPAEGGPGDNTWGDYVALLHSEVSEMLEAYRDHRLTDATVEPRRHEMGTCSFPPTCDNTLCAVHAVAKPEGVGSELADCVIRLLDMADVFGLTPFDMDCELNDVAPIDGAFEAIHWLSFGDGIAWLHSTIAHLWIGGHRGHVHVFDQVDALRADGMTRILRALATIAIEHDFDLDREVVRKMAYNRTRPYQHGGRTLAGPLNTFRKG